MEGILRNFTLSGSYRLRKHLYSIGNSSGRPNSGVKPSPIWVLSLTATKENEIGIPNVKLIGTVHGTEPVGQEVLLHFIEYLIEEYEKDGLVTWLLNNTKIHILPNLNPDGYKVAKTFFCYGCADCPGLGVTDEDIVISSDFPDYFHRNEVVNHTAETLAVMKWMDNIPFTLSGSFFGTFLVAIYPYCNRNETMIRNPTPDDDVFQFLAKTYSFNHATMHTGQNCPAYKKRFDGGIINGASWHNHDADMTDYNYIFHGCMEVRFEISCCKYPPIKDLKYIWADNKNAILNYIMQANRGVTGQVLDEISGRPIEATMKIIGRNIQFKNFGPTGEFWRILLPGEYIVEVEAKGYYKKIQNFTVKEYGKSYPQLTKLNIFLLNSSIPTTSETTVISSTTSTTQKTTTTSSIGEQLTTHMITTISLANPISRSQLLDFVVFVIITKFRHSINMACSGLRRAMIFSVFIIGVFGGVYGLLEFKYHTNDELQDVLKELENTGKKKLSAKLYSIGNSSNPDRPFPLWVFSLTAADPSQYGIPNVKLLGNLHGNEAGGREILLQLIEYLIDQFDKDKNVTWLLKNTKIHIVPTINPDGFEVAGVACKGITGRNVPFRDIDLNRNFPDFFCPDPDLILSKESEALINWMTNTKFILSAALHEGALVANYPYDLNPNNADGEAFETPDKDVFKYLARTYSNNHPKMHKGEKCPDNNEKFVGGITNGAAWYGFRGGMGDYNYNFHGCMELTLELSCCKRPHAELLSTLWNENKLSLLLYCMQANRGVTGRVLDSETRQPIEAKLKIIGREKLVLWNRSEYEIFFLSYKKTGEFWRLLLPGTYTLKVEANGYKTEYKKFTVKEHNPFPKLTNLTLFLTNSSLATTTSSTEKNTIVSNFSSRLSEDDSVEEITESPKVGELKGFAKCINNNVSFSIFTIHILFLLR
ncbi:carboxypeptidase D-like [Diorhabda sublineata]|uniref:carboxypeptidase D-like n=1 Tax=Diorhabda sublineata TaxID=1163346 RepID=UPI0024E0D8F1|nr:carboxypeptidase D-like [Diorhabda sublineata]